ncbi:MAG: hypothetical protein NTY10_06735 [Candidatus Omnitrophica bacterium]|nr:hypothetical protein [Candidatus Omnitrophota bacterium]
MEYVAGYLSALIVVAVGLLGIILALIVLEVSKAKFVLALILSLIVVGLGGYYYYVVGQAEQGVANPNVLNSVLKVSAVVSVPPSVILPSSVTTGEMIPTVPRGEKNESGVKKESAAPVKIKIKESKSMER